MRQAYKFPKEPRGAPPPRATPAASAAPSGRCSGSPPPRGPGPFDPLLPPPKGRLQGAYRGSAFAPSWTLHARFFFLFADTFSSPNPIESVYLFFLPPIKHRLMMWIVICFFLCFVPQNGYHDPRGGLTAVTTASGVGTRASFCDPPRICAPAHLPPPTSGRRPSTSARSGTAPPGSGCVPPSHPLKAHEAHRRFLCPQCGSVCCSTSLNLCIQLRA